MTKKILVADDSVTIHMIVNLTFAGEDVSVQAVTSGDRALEKAREMKPDVILADLEMPGLSGYELCERIKSEPLLTGIPVILLAGSVDPFDEERARRSGAAGHLTKPFATDELIETVRKVCAMQPETPSAPPPHMSTQGPDRSLVSQRTRESFLGANRILDVFGILLPPEQPADRAGIPEPEPAKPAPEPLPEASLPEPTQEELSTAQLEPPAISGAGQPPTAEPVPEKVEFELSEEAMNAIVEKVVRHVSRDIIREVAWEVVPELAEIGIRQWLKENMQSLQKNIAANTP